MYRHENIFTVTGLALCLILAPAPRLLAGGRPKPLPPPIINPAIAFTSEGGIHLITADGTKRQQLTPLATNHNINHSPVWSPDGTRIAFLRSPDFGLVYADLYTIKPDGTDMRLVRSFNDLSVQIPSRMAWTPDGCFLVYSDEPWGAMSVLNVQTGAYAEMPPMPGLAYLANPSPGPDWAPETPGFQGYIVCEAALGAPMGEWGPGGLVVFSANITMAGDVPEIVVGDCEFLPVPHPDPDESLTVRCPVFSPDGESIAFLRRDFNAGGPILYVLDVAAIPGSEITLGEPVQICDWWDYRPNGDIYFRPTWSPDSAYIGFAAISAWKNGGGFYLDLFRIRPDGSELVPVTSVTDRQSASTPNWNPAWVNDLDP